MNLLVVGNIAYDTLGDVKFLPERNQATCIDNISFSYGGCAGNVAVATRKLGVKTSIYSIVGEDFKNSDYLKYLEETDIDTSYLQYSRHPTARSFIFTDREKNQQIFYYPGASSTLKPHAIDFKKFSHIHFTAGEITSYRRLMEEAIKSGCTVSFDLGQEIFHRPKGQVVSLLDYASYLFFNEHEANFLLNEINKKDIREIFSDKTIAIVVSKGENGSVLYTQDNETEIDAIYVEEVKDPTGAGDAYRAGFLAGIIKGYDEETSCKIGSIVASFVVRKEGTQTNLPNWEEMERVYKEIFGEIRL